MSDYLRANSRFDNKQFERQFQIMRSIFEYIFQRLAAHDEYGHDGKDCTQRTKIKPEVKLMAALKVILFGVLFGTFCDYLQMGESTVRHAVLKFARGVLQINEITKKYLRKLTKSDAKKVSELHNNVELFAKYKYMQSLGQRLRLINMRWKKLTNINDQERLQNAIKFHLMILIFHCLPFH